VLLAFVSAFVQAVAAIALVAVLALAIGATARQMDDVALQLERISYALIACVGALLTYRKGAALWATVAPRLGVAGPALVHIHGPDCSHAPILPPQNEERMGFRGAIGAVLAVGVRPCTGAIIVLVFSLAQGLFLAGIAATFAMALGTALTVAAIACLSVAAKGVAVRLAAPGHAGAAIALRVAELAIALGVLALGLTLLAGLAAPMGQA
jgi:nickel/cobalt transporter (NicO) family protein